MYVGLKQPRGDGERYVTPARAAAKETMGAIHWTKISGLRFENFLVSNGSRQVRNGLIPFHSQNEFHPN